ncbi:MAG: hypothetical protein JSU61_08290 [Fidelibacterota bacterium]|nr:MAG: hypothetical protein JSU61_08290 [Candidatus Neomarinimicrobiota bacterium]
MSSSTGIYRILWESKRFIIINFVAVSIVAAIVSLLLPKWYKSSATVFPPSSAQGESIVTGMGVVNPLVALGLGGVGEEINKYIAIVKSRSLRERIINAFDLKVVYETETIEETLWELDSRIEIAVTDEGALTFGVLDRDTLRAKAMADSILFILGETTTQLGSKAAQRNRRFILNRITAIKAELAVAERDLRDLTAEHGTYNLPTQLDVVIGQLVQLEVMLAQAEIEYNVASASMNTRNPQLDQLRIQRDEISKKVEELMAGGGKSNLLPNLQELPDVALWYARLTRDVKILGALLEFLYPQYEQARLQAAKDEPMLLVLDYPKVAQRRVKPVRSLIVLACGLFSIVVSSLWVVFRSQTQHILS